MTLHYRGTMQRLELEALPRHFGGVQWYVACPFTGRRVTSLWMPPGSPTFASRHAWGRRVAYATQFEDPTGRAWAKKRRVVRRLGGTDPNCYRLPEKPKWMRQATYDRLVDCYYEAEDDLDAQFAWAAARILTRYGRGLFRGG